MAFLFDTHVHTSETSSCSNVDARTMVRLYKQRGFDGVVVTDHYHDGFFEGPFADSVDWETKVRCFLGGYRAARKEGENIGLRVLMGMEINFTPLNVDFLVFGIDEDFLIRYPRLWSLTLPWFSKLAHERGMLVYQAHPCRPPTEPADHRCLDGVEVYNGSPGYLAYNADALAFANVHGLAMSAGSDFHRVSQLARGGIYLPEMPDDAKDLVRLMKAHAPLKLFTAGDVEPEAESEQAETKGSSDAGTLITHENGLELSVRRLDDGDAMLTFRNESPDPRIAYASLETIGLSAPCRVRSIDLETDLGFADKEVSAEVPGLGSHALLLRSLLC